MYSTVVYRNPDIYNSSNKLHVRDAKHALDKYLCLLRWKDEESIVDIGSGSGNVTTQVLAARLPADFKRLVGFDLSEFNRKYATKNNTDSRIRFIQGDIVQPDLQLLKEYFVKENIEPLFDKVISLHCLHWVLNSELWSRNMYSLLKPGGQIFLMFMTTNCTFLEAWIDTAFNEKWTPYTKAIGQYRNEFYYSTDIDRDLTKVLTNAGFDVEFCDHYQCSFDPEWPLDLVYNLFLSADPYLHTIPKNLQSDYMKDLRQSIEKYRNIFNETGMPYTTSVIVASKPEVGLQEQKTADSSVIRNCT